VPPDDPEGPTAKADITNSKAVNTDPARLTNSLCQTWNAHGAQRKLAPLRRPDVPTFSTALPPLVKRSRAVT